MRVASYYCFVVYNHLHVIVTLFPLQEFLVKNADREELMAMLGLFGGIFSAIQMYPCFGQMESGDVGIVMCI
jgi:hypothetical protein